MSEDQDLANEIELLRQLFLPAPEGAATLEEFEAGFTEERAHAILDTPECLHHFRVLAAHAEVGAAWFQQVFGDGNQASAELLLVALGERPATYLEALTISRQDGVTTITPSRLEHVAVAHLARLDLPGGWAAWHPADLGCPPVVSFDGDVTPNWLPDLLGDSVARDLEAGGGKTTLDTIDVTPHPVGRLALGLWLRGNSMPLLSETALCAELGGLALEHAELLGGDALAADLLADAGPTLLALAAETTTWERQRKQIATDAVRQAVRAFLQLHPQAREAEALADVLAHDLQQDLQDTPKLPSQYALAAGGDEAEPNPLALPVSEIREEAIAEVDLGFDDWQDHPARPFVAELIIHPKKQ